MDGGHTSMHVSATRPRAVQCQLEAECKGTTTCANGWCHDYFDTRNLTPAGESECSILCESELQLYEKYFYLREAYIDMILAPGITDGDCALLFTPTADIQHLLYNDTDIHTITSDEYQRQRAGTLIRYELYNSTHYVAYCISKSIDL